MKRGRDYSHCGGIRRMDCCSNILAVRRAILVALSSSCLMVSCNSQQQEIRGQPPARLEFRVAARLGDFSSSELAEIRIRLATDSDGRGTGRVWRWFALNDPAQWSPHQIDRWDSFLTEPARCFEEHLGFVADSKDGQCFLLLTADPQHMLVHGSEDSWSVASAYSTHDNTGRPAIGFALDEKGSRRFAILTSRAVGRNLAILIDDKIYSAPKVIDPVDDGRSIISGSFNRTQFWRILKILQD